MSKSYNINKMSLRWVFSKQSQPELEEFLNAVKAKNNKGNICKKNNLLNNVLPQFPLNHYEQQESNRLNDNEIIMIEDEPMEEVSSENLNVQNNLQTSIINLTLVDTADENNGNVKDFLEYLSEGLNNENLIQSTDIKGMSLELNQMKIKELFNALKKQVSNKGLLKLGESICLYSDFSTTNIAKEYCEIIFFEKLINLESAQTFKILLDDFIKIYPEIVRKHILLPFLIEDYKCIKTYQMILSSVSDTEKELLLRDFVFSANELKEFQLPLLQPLIKLTMDQTVKRRLINLMSISADTFKTNKQFLVVLMDIINNLEKSFLDQEHIFLEIIDKNKTILQKIAKKTLNEWVNNCTSY